ncbi:hypothetical protein CC80DRAFT_469828 [Byssothecium circinans]|uniref:DUF1308 domain-containing protein n=1 Tax=Byssothecium circinans TaxID=147558 RepID=A0A6A5U0K1_9PLEO|nr:hypothetical protein CC80DRAFT_469828 [Byssothecium circinans]
MAEPLVSSMGELDLEDPQKIIQATIDRGNALLQEVELYVSAVVAHEKIDRVPHKVNFRTLQSDLKNELAALEKLKTTNPSTAQVRSNNLVYWEALWAASKRSSGLVDFRRYFYWNQRKHGDYLRGKFKDANRSVDRRTKNVIPGRKATDSTLVDIVARGGHEWVRVSTATQSRLLHDLAKLGWQNDSDSDLDSENGATPDTLNSTLKDEDDEDQVFLVKNARELARAAHAHPFRDRPPVIRIVLSRLESGKQKEVDAVLDKMRATGAVVECANELSEPPPLDSVLPNLLVYPSHTSETLNIDCTVLMAMISDISHWDCPVKKWYPAEVCKQIEEEKDQKLLPDHLYPAIGSHPMVCTQGAADQMNFIVDTLATDNKARANIMLGQKDRQNVAPDILLDQWQELSDHPIPAGFQLPIRAVTVNIDDLMKTLPAVAKNIAPELGPLNAAIFFYGWAFHLTTLSANRTRVNQIERKLEKVGLTDGEAPPHIWCCGVPRSLIAKSGRPSREGKHTKTFKEV